MLSAMNIITTSPTALNSHAPALSSLEEQTEDTASLIPDTNMTTAQRKKWSAKQPNRQAITFLKNSQCYFETYTQYLDVASFSVKVPGFSVDIKNALNDQPIKFGIQNKDGSKTFLVVEIYHS